MNESESVKSLLVMLEQTYSRLNSIIESLPISGATDDALTQAIDLSTDLERYFEELKEENHDTSRI